jgi:hypothetical protein
MCAFPRSNPAKFCETGDRNFRIPIIAMSVFLHLPRWLEFGCGDFVLKAGQND